MTRHRVHTIATSEIPASGASTDMDSTAPVFRMHHCISEKMKEAQARTASWRKMPFVAQLDLYHPTIFPTMVGNNKHSPYIEAPSIKTSREDGAFLSFLRRDCFLFELDCDESSSSRRFMRPSREDCSSFACCLKARETPTSGMMEMSGSNVTGLIVIFPHVSG